MSENLLVGRARRLLFGTGSPGACGGNDVIADDMAASKTLLIATAAALVAIGVAGLPALWDRRGETDMYGYTLQHTEVGTADELAAAASLVMGQAAEGTPFVLARGLRLPAVEGKAADLIRPAGHDLYR